jgi:hypothetical protein
MVLASFPEFYLSYLYKIRCVNAISISYSERIGIIAGRRYQKAEF